MDLWINTAVFRASIQTISELEQMRRLPRQILTGIKRSNVRTIYELAIRQAWKTAAAGASCAPTAGYPSNGAKAMNTARVI